MGFFVPEPEFRLKTPLPALVGPIVHLQRCTEELWAASVFIAYQGTECPTLTYATSSDNVAVQPQYLETVLEWNFARFPLRVPPGDTSQSIRYTVHGPSGAVSGQVTVPAKHEEWNLVAYSCYDQRRAIGEALWKHIEGNSQKAVHCILGTGDQLYNDNLWETPALKAWVALPMEERLTKTPDKSLIEEVTRFYLESYLRNAHFHPAAALFRNTPQLNTWDDHDIFDGWGSYPPELQLSSMFQAIFGQAQRIYLLFQQGTTPSLAADDGYVISPAASAHGANYPGYSFVSQLGPSVCVAFPDTRSQRSRERIMQPDTLKRVVLQVREMPATVKHLLFISAVPVAYPSMKTVEKLLHSVEDGTSLLNKTGLAKKLNNDFGLPDLLDDVSDHWSAEIHAAEKAEILTELRNFADSRQMRVTLVSGDVHLCAFGWVSSHPARSFGLDPGYMPQIVTSAIGNKPPANFVVKYLQTNVKQDRVIATGSTCELRETLSEIFKATAISDSKQFCNHMNYCDLSIIPSASGAKCLKFSLAILNGAEDGVGDVVGAVIPPMLTSEQAAKEGDTFDLKAIKPAKPTVTKRCCALCCLF